MQIDSLPPLREVVANHRLDAQRSLGQNFILDLNLTAKIARLSGVLKGHDILEVGPGPGGLTRGLLAEGARKVVVLEKDSRCLPALKEIASVYGEKLAIFNVDALDFNPIMHLQQPVRIVCNLPYNIGTELLIRWLTPTEWPPFWHTMTLMFQKEVAERITALPGTKSYGRLAILSQWKTDAKIVMSLPPEVFSPPPKVNSSVVHFEALTLPRFPAPAKLLSSTVAMAFNQRRKMLRSSLKSAASNIEKILQDTGIDPTARAEEVSLEQFCALARQLAD